MIFPGQRLRGFSATEAAALIYGSIVIGDGVGGFISYVAFVPGRDVGLFVAVNRVDFTMFFGLSTAANELLASLAPRRPSSGVRVEDRYERMSRSRGLGL